MSKILQDQYIPMLGLEGLKKTGTKKYNTRCPYCGDSKTKKTKKRGWFLWNDKYNTYVYNCFNCDTVTNFDGVCKFMSPSVYEVYKTKEREETLSEFIDSMTSTKNKQKSNIDENIDISLECLPSGTINCTESSQAIEYLQKRKIPKNIYVNWKYNKSYGIIIPFEYSRETTSDGFFYGWQARQINKKDFHTSLPESNPKLWNWFSINKKQPVYILESIIDASMMSLLNYQSIAMVGADIKKEYVDELKEPFFIFDNDETGVKKTIKYSKLYPNAHFLIWNKKIKQKDLNEIIVSGVSVEKFKKFIDTSFVNGFKASIIFQFEKGI